MAIDATVDSIVYDSFLVIYKTEDDLKMVNGFNRHGSSTRWLAFINGTTEDNIKGDVDAESAWLTSFEEWDVDDISSIYGPLALAIESPNEDLSDGFGQWTSVLCMGTGLDLVIHCP